MTVLMLVVMAVSVQATGVERIVTLNGDITEIVFALGFEDQIVAVDASSNYPEEANDLPNVGYQGRLSVEGILAFEPTLVIANEDAGPPQVLAQLAAAGVRVETIETDNTLATPPANIRAVAAHLGASERGEVLAQELEDKISAVAQRGSELAKKPRILFLYLGSAHIQFAGGMHSPSNAMIEGAGGIDVGVEAGFVGYMPFTPEALVSAQPEILIVTERGLATVGGIEGVLKIPGVAQTPAGASGSVIVFEDLYFIGMGPRTGDALTELVDVLHSMQ